MKYHHKSYKVLMVLGPLIISGIILIAALFMPYIKQYFEEKISDFLYIVFSLFALTALLYTFLIKPLEDKIKERYSYLEDNNLDETVKEVAKQNIFTLRTWQKVINLYFIVSICILGIGLSMIIFDYPILVRAFLLIYIIVLQIMFLVDLAIIIIRTFKYDFRGLEKKYFQALTITNKTEKDCKVMGAIKKLIGKWWFWALIVVVGGVLVFNIVAACIWKDGAYDNANLFTAISGILSGIATAFLGGVALLQNKKYKEMTDDIQLKPDFFVDKIGVSNGSLIHDGIIFVAESFENEYQLCNIEVINYLDKPVFNFRLIKEIVILENQEEKKHLFNLSNYNRFAVMEKGQRKIFQASIPKTLNNGKIEFTFSFENAYKNKYTKKIIIGIRTSFLPPLSIDEQEISVKEQNNG